MNFKSILTFGKYKGTSIGYIFKINAKYLNWCLENTILLEKLSKTDKKKIRSRANYRYTVVYGNGFSNEG